MDIFSKDLNSSMMYKGQHPEYVLIVSLETNHSEFDSFWENPSIIQFISSKTIVVRLSQDENVNDIQLFEFTFHHSSIPSLFIFGSNQAIISHSWRDNFPTVEEFSQYFEDINNSNENSSNDEQKEIQEPSLQQHSTSNLMPPVLLQQFHSSQNNENISDGQTNSKVNSSTTSSNQASYTPLKPPSTSQELIKRPTPRSQPQQKSALITSTVDRSSNKPEKTQKSNSIARISVQGLTKTVNKNFPYNSTIGDLRSWIHSEFGRDLDLIVVHTHADLPTDPNITFSQADLCPSAVIRERDGGNATLRNDEDLNIGINERNREISNRNNIDLSNIYEDENVVTNSPSSANSSGSAFNNSNNAQQIRRTNINNGGFGQILKYLKLLVRLLNPWSDDENEFEDEPDGDLERNFWEFKANPNYMNSMLSQMDQNARQNVQQEDTWRPSRF